MLGTLMMVGLRVTALVKEAALDKLGKAGPAESGSKMRLELHTFI